MLKTKEQIEEYVLKHLKPGIKFECIEIQFHKHWTTERRRAFRLEFEINGGSNPVTFSRRSEASDVAVVIDSYIEAVNKLAI